MLWTLWGLGRDNVAPSGACTFLVLCGHCPIRGMYFPCIMWTLPHDGPIMYVYYVSPLNRLGHVCIVLPTMGFDVWHYLFVA